MNILFFTLNQNTEQIKTAYRNGFQKQQKSKLEN